MKKTFCLVESNANNSYKFLSLIISLNAVETSCQLVISCSDNTKKLIENFPFSYSVSLDFVSKNQGKFDCLSQFNRIIDCIKYTVKKFGSCIYLNDNLQPIQKLNIPDKIIEQGIGFSKKYFNSHDFNINKKRYSLDIFYISKLYYLDSFLELFKEIDFKNSDIKTKTQFRDIYDISPYLLRKKLNLQHNFSCNSLISTSDFFSYRTIITLQNINKDFTINSENYSKEPKLSNLRDDNEEDKENINDLEDLEIELNDMRIYYINLDLSKNIPNVITINKEIISKLLVYDSFFENILNISNSNLKVALNTGKKDSIGIWDRRLSSPGLYELFEMIHDIYPEYTSLNASKSNYFSANFSVILDKSNKEWITNEITMYKKQFICNYNKEMMDILRKYNDQFKLNYSFLFMFANLPKKVDNYYYKNKQANILSIRSNNSVEIETIDDFTYKIDNIYYKIDSTLNILSKTRYAYLLCKNIDLNLIIICMITGCIPVLNCYLHKNYGLLSGVNIFFRSVPKITEKIYLSMKKAVMEYYEFNVSPRGVFKNLVNKLFVRNVE